MNGNFTWREKELLAKIMEEGEEVIAVGKQHRLSKLIAPSIALSTNKRLVIMKRDSLGIRTDMHVIPYDSIVSFRILNGFVFSSIKLRLLGAVKPDEHAVTNTGEDETEISGLTKAMAKSLALKISENISKRREEKEAKQQQTVIKHSTPVINIFFSTNFVAPNSLVPGMYLPSHAFSDQAYPPKTQTQAEPQKEEQKQKAEEVEREDPEENGEVAYELEPSASKDAEIAKKEIEVRETMRHEENAQNEEIQAVAKQAKEASTNMQESKPQLSGTAVEAAVPKSAEPKEVNPADLLIFKNRKSHIGSIGFLESLFAGKNAAKHDELIDEITKKWLSSDE